MEKRKALTPQGTRAMETAIGRRKKFLRMAEAAQFYSIGKHTMERLAKEAEAIYKYDGVVLVNVEIVDRYLETFKL